MLSFCVVVTNAFAVTPVVTVPYSPPLFSPPQSLKRSGELRWEVWGTEGSPPAQSDTCLPGSHSKTGGLYLYNCSTESWWTKLPCQAALGGRIASRGAIMQWENRKAKFKFPQSLLEPLLRLLGSWRFGEPGSGKRPAVWPRLSSWTGKWFLSGPHGLPYLWFSLSAVFPCIQS